jgi:hypothetical protein
MNEKVLIRTGAVMLGNWRTEEPPGVRAVLDGLGARVLEDAFTVVHP